MKRKEKESVATALQENKKLKETDLIVEDPKIVSGLKSDTGYIFNLTEEQVVKIIYFFGARKCAVKAIGTGSGSRLNTFTDIELKTLKMVLGWLGLLPADESEAELKKAYRALVVKFKNILDFLRARPAFITDEIYKALKQGGYERVLKNVIMVVDENRRVVPKVVDSTVKENIPPIGKADQLIWEIQNISLDKILTILQFITPKDIKKANLGVKSKALRDIFAMYHMSKINNKNPNLTLFNLNVYTSSQEEKLRSYQQYLTKNRES